MTNCFRIYIKNNPEQRFVVSFPPESLSVSLNRHEIATADDLLKVFLDLKGKIQVDELKNNQIVKKVIDYSTPKTKEFQFAIEGWIDNVDLTLKTGFENTYASKADNTSVESNLNDPNYEAKIEKIGVNDFDGFALFKVEIKNKKTNLYSKVFKKVEGYKKFDKSKLVVLNNQKIFKTKYELDWFLRKIEATGYDPMDILKNDPNKLLEFDSLPESASLKLKDSFLNMDSNIVTDFKLIFNLEGKIQADEFNDNKVEQKFVEYNPAEEITISSTSDIFIEKSTLDDKERAKYELLNAKNTHQRTVKIIKHFIEEAKAEKWSASFIAPLEQHENNTNEKIRNLETAYLNDFDKWYNENNAANREETLKTVNKEAYEWEWFTYNSTLYNQVQQYSQTINSYKSKNDVYWKPVCEYFDKEIRLYWSRFLMTGGVSITSEKAKIANIKKDFHEIFLKQINDNWNIWRDKITFALEQRKEYCDFIRTTDESNFDNKGNELNIKTNILKADDALNKQISEIKPQELQKIYSDLILSIDAFDSDNLSIIHSFVSTDFVKNKYLREIEGFDEMYAPVTKLIEESQKFEAELQKLFTAKEAQLKDPNFVKNINDDYKTQFINEVKKDIENAKNLYLAKNSKKLAIYQKILDELKNANGILLAKVDEIDQLKNEAQNDSTSTILSNRELVFKIESYNKFTNFIKDPMTKVLNEVMKFKTDESWKDYFNSNSADINDPNKTVDTITSLVISAVTNIVDIMDAKDNSTKLNEIKTELTNFENTNKNLIQQYLNDNHYNELYKKQINNNLLKDIVDLLDAQKTANAFDVDAIVFEMLYIFKKDFSENLTKVKTFLDDNLAKVQTIRKPLIDKYNAIITEAQNLQTTWTSKSVPATEQCMIIIKKLIDKESVAEPKSEDSNDKVKEINSLAQAELDRAKAAYEEYKKTL